MSILGKLKGIFGLGGDNEETQISTFDTAGMPDVATTGAVEGQLESQAQVIPQQIVTGYEQTQTQPPASGTGTTGGVTIGAEGASIQGQKPVPKNQDLASMLQFGGMDYDEGTRARKLQAVAGTRDLTNADFYPSRDLIGESRTAWNDPIFAGSGAIFPAAVAEARRKAQAEGELKQMKEEALNITPPKVNVPAYAERFRSDFVDETRGLVSDYVAKYGTQKNAIKAMRQDGSLSKLMAKYQALADDINQTGDNATAYLKQMNEKAGLGDEYFDPKATIATRNFLAGMDEFGKGNLSHEQLGELRSQMNAYQSWQKYKENMLPKLKPFEQDVISQAQQASQMELTPEDRVAYDAYVKQNQAQGIDLPGGLAGQRAFLIRKKVSEVMVPQAIESIIKPFFRDNPSAMRQLGFEGLKPEQQQAKMVELANEITSVFGRQIENQIIQQKPSASTKISIDNGQPTKKTFYQSIDEKKSEIMSEAVKAKPTNVAQAKQVAEQIYGGGTADDFFFGIRAFDWPSINKSIASMPYSELYEPNATDVGTKQEVFFGKVNKKNAGIPDTNTTAKNLKVQGVVNGFISKGKDGQIRVFSNEDMVNKPLTADYKPYMIQVVTDEKYETSGSDVDPNDVGAILESLRSAKKSPSTSGIYYRFIPLDKSTATTFDKDADMSSQFTGGTDGIKVTGEVVEDFD